MHLNPCPINKFIVLSRLTCSQKLSAGKLIIDWVDSEITIVYIKPGGSLVAQATISMIYDKNQFADWQVAEGRATNLG